MLPVLHGDLVAAARALHASPAAGRGERLARMLNEADWAEAYRRREGRTHPIWGDGSLISAAQRRAGRAAPSLDDVGYCTCMAMVLEALIARRR